MKSIFNIVGLLLLPALLFGQTIDVQIQEAGGNVQIVLMANGQDFTTENWNDLTVTLRVPDSNPDLGSPVGPPINFVGAFNSFANKGFELNMTGSSPITNSGFKYFVYSFAGLGSSLDNNAYLKQDEPVVIQQVPLNGNSFNDVVLSLDAGNLGGTETNYYVEINGQNYTGTSISDIYYAKNDINVEVFNNPGTEFSWFFGSNNLEPGSSDASKSVFVLEHGASISGAADINSLTIESDGSLDINPGASLNVNGTATNSANADSLMLRADGTGYAQYLGPAIAGTYEQYIDGSAGWRYISSPVDGNTINDLNFSQPFTVVTDGSNAQNVWAYNASTGQWEPGGSADISQRGVNVYFQNSELPMTISTSGTLNSGNGTRTINTEYNNPTPGTNTNGGGTGWADAVTEGWNLVANPYPTTLNVADMSFPTDMDDAIYIWDANAGNFAAYVGGVGTNNGTQYIAPMNAFYVRVDAASATGTETLDFTSAGVIASPNFLKAPAEVNGLYMTAINPLDKKDEVFVGFNYDATEDFDKSYDAYKMPSTNINVPNLATGEDVLSINNLPEMFGGDQYTIPVIFESAHDGVHKFSWDLTNLDYDVEVYLEDKVEGIMYPLDGNDYQFNHSTTDRKDRFVLHFNRGVVSDEPFADESNFNMWMGWENTVNVEFAQDGFADISITNVMGQVITSDSNIDMSETYQIQIPNATSAAIYVVTITTSNGDQYTQKLLAR